MYYNIKIEAFEGPLDLLFHLIEKNEIDIYDIPMTEVTEQYVQYLKAMEELDLDIASEFLVMAATLIEIKSKMLLPLKVVEDQQLEMAELDPRSELVRKLLEYKKYKLASEHLKEREKLFNRLFFKVKEEIILEPSKSETDIGNITIEDLINAFSKIASCKGNEKKKKQYYNVRQMHRETITIEEKIEQIITLLAKKEEVAFESLFLDASNRLEVITTFLATLELIRMKKILVFQSHSFSEIMIKARK